MCCCVCMHAGLSAGRKADIESNCRLLHYNRLHIRRVRGTLLVHTQRHLAFNVVCVFLYVSYHRTVVSAREIRTL